MIDLIHVENSKSDNSFGKDYKLCSKRVIDELFVSGETLKQYPLRLLFLIDPIHSSDKTTFQIVISVPKKKIRKAHDRNKIKRMLRELVRNNKHELEHQLTNEQVKLALFLIYSDSTELDYSIMEKKFKKLIQQLQNKITHVKN